MRTLGMSFAARQVSTAASRPSTSASERRSSSITTDRHKRRGEYTASSRTRHPISSSLRTRIRSSRTYTNPMHTTHCRNRDGECKTQPIASSQRSSRVRLPTPRGLYSWTLSPRGSGRSASSFFLSAAPGRHFTRSSTQAPCGISIYSVSPGWQRAGGALRVPMGRRRACLGSSSQLLRPVCTDRPVCAALARHRPAAGATARTRA